MSDEFPYTLLPPPDELSEQDTIPDSDISYIGKTRYIAGIYQNHDLFGIKRVDRNRHVYIVGKSGMGKSYLLENLIRSDINFNFGLTVIDPHGDLVYNLAQCIPENRIKDTIYIDPSQTDVTLAFNPFANVEPIHRQRVAQGLVEIFKKQFASTWTPRIEHLFRFATLAMLEYREGTLYGLLQLITDAKYRQNVMKEIEDDVIKRFFSVEFAGFSQKYDQEAITPLSNRLGHFFSDTMMRKIFSNPVNKIDIADIMAHNKILLINTAKGILGEENSALFGSFFLTKIEQAAMARALVEKEQRKPFYLYVDEFQNVASESFVSLFSESRKYNINITIANQYLSQIHENLRDSILGNVATLMVFRLGGEDAERMTKEFQPQLKSHDFLNLGVGEFYIKMPIEGKTTRPFSASTLHLDPPPFPDHMQKIIDHTKYDHMQTTDETSYQQASHTDDELAMDVDNLPPPL